MKRDPLPTWRAVLGGYLKAQAIRWIRSYAYRRAMAKQVPPWIPPGPVELPQGWQPPGLLPPLPPRSYVHLYEQRGTATWPHYCTRSSHHHNVHHNVTTANGDPVCCCGYDPIADMHVPRPRNHMEADRLVRSHVNQHGS